MPPDPLDEFALPALSHTGLFGVFLAAHAIPDALDVLHAGVGCKGKTQRHLVEHDLGRESHTQVGWTELSEDDLIRDAGAPLLRNIGELASRRRPGVMLLTTSAAVDLTSLQVEGLLSRAREAAGCPVIWVPEASRLPDLWAGYAAVVAGIVERIDWSRPADASPDVCLVGHLLHRYEADQAADLAELARLCEAVGVHCGAILLGAVPYARLLEANRAAAIVRMPHAGLGVDELAGLTGRRVARAGLPMGSAGCRAWLESLQATGLVPAGALERTLKREEARLAPRLAVARRLLAGRRLAIMADTPAAAGWTVLAGELGLVPKLVVLLDKSLGGPAAYEDLLAWAHTPLPAELEVVEHPSLRSLHARDASDLDLCVRPDLALAGSDWDRIPTVLAGFPSYGRHGIFPAAALGYTGLVAQAQRMCDAVSDAH